MTSRPKGWIEIEPFSTYVLPGTHTVRVGPVTIVAVRENGTRDSARFLANRPGRVILEPSMLREVPPLP